MKSPKRQLADQRLEETIAYLWSCYRKDRANIEIRNHLVEHYTPLVQQITRHFIRRYRLREVETAIGDALLLLVVRLVPQYDGKKDFCRWAAIRIRHKMRERRRLELLNGKRFAKRTDCERHWPEIEARLVRPAEPGSDVRFAEIVAALPARDAAALWLRFYRRISMRDISAALSVSHNTAASLVRGAIGTLRELAEEKAM